MREDARKLLVDVGLVACGAQLTLVAALAAARPHAEEIGAVFPPWWPPARAFAAAAGAGRVVTLGHVPGAIVVHGTADDLAARLRQAGALLTIDARFVAGCRAATPEVRG